MKPKIKSALLCAAYFIISFAAYAAIWYFALMFFFVTGIEGLHINFAFAYGAVFAYIYKFIGVAVFLSFFFLFAVSVKKKRIYPVLIAFALSIVLFISFIVLDNFAYSRIEFTTDAWVEYPMCRMALFDKFKEEYDIQGYSREEVISLLGQPDAISDSTYIYSDGFGNGIYIAFSEYGVVDYYAIS